jgi:thiol-disulfide isomerase/thioredoxin
LTGLLVALGVLAVASAVGAWWRRRDGRLRPVAGPAAELSSLGVRGGQVTLLQFSSAFCAPCRATRRVLADVAATLPGVAHVEVDAESHLDEVRALDIWRTPTVLVVDGSGRVVHRASGAPSKAQVLATVAPLLAGAA